MARKRSKNRPLDREINVFCPDCVQMRPARKIALEKARKEGRLFRCRSCAGRLNRARKGEPSI